MKPKLIAFLATSLAFLGGTGAFLAKHNAIEASDTVTVNTAGAGLVGGLAIIIGAVIWHQFLVLTGRYAPTLKDKLSNDNSSNTSGPSGGILPLLLLGATMATLAGGLSSCSNFSTSGMTGTLSYVDGKPSISLTVPIKDSTGKVVGTADIAGSDGSKPSVTIDLGAPAAPVVTPPVEVSPAK